MSSLFSWLGRLLLSALQWLPAGMRRDFAPRALEDHSISVSVRAPGHGQVELSLDRGWSVAEVRRRLADRLGSPPGAGGRGRVKIILAGQALADDVLVSDCDLGQRTVLHAVVVRVEEEEEEDVREIGKGGLGFLFKMVLVENKGYVCFNAPCTVANFLVQSWKEIRCIKKET